ncbi:MAG: formate dehydrogenase accessory protein FdhE [Firmicutes bacterium]|nr:formate dehydrogenase accessory protein FdhE [Bacillota bacterium]
MSKNPPVVMPVELIEFYQALIKLQTEIGELLVKPQWQIDEAQAFQHQYQGKPWLEIVHLGIEPPVFARVWRQMAEFLAEQRPPVREEIERILATQNELDFGELATRAVQQDEGYLAGKAARLGVNSSLFFLLAEHAVRPFMRGAALVLAPYIDQERWLKDVCPVCGKKASISKLREEDGKRVMFCPHCSTEWLYRHLACPQCGNDDHQSIRFFTVEGYDAHQVYVCEKCKGYIKTYDEKKGGPLNNIELEDVKTIYLDMLAEREGYVNDSLQKKLLH